jgi:hypothetical protein
MYYNPNVPSTWYQYDFPLKEIPNSPKPSVADYKPSNVAWMIEMFASIFQKTPDELVFLYENNTPNDKSDDIEVRHPMDRLYLEDRKKLKKSDELSLYEEYAKKSKTLRLFEENSPAGIKYFQEIR